MVVIVVVMDVVGGYVCQCDPPPRAPLWADTWAPTTGSATSVASVKAPLAPLVWGALVGHLEGPGGHQGGLGGPTLLATVWGRIPGAIGPSPSTGVDTLTCTPLDTCRPLPDTF